MGPLPQSRSGIVAKPSAFPVRRLCCVWPRPARCGGDKALRLYATLHVENRDLRQCIRAPAAGLPSPRDKLTAEIVNERVAELCRRPVKSQPDPPHDGQAIRRVLRWLTTERKTQYFNFEHRSLSLKPRTATVGSCSVHL